MLQHIMSNCINRAYSTEKAVQRLLEVNINFLAIDFDQTFIDIHTGGVWPGTLKELITHVRPEFRDLLQCAMEHNIHVAIVTFSRQTNLVKGVMEAVVGVEQASKIPIRGGDRSWKYEGVGSREGKQAHMASAVEELEQQQQQQHQQQQPRPQSGGNGGVGVEITKSTTLLIDDDKRNIRTALEDGVRAVWFNPDKPHRLLRELTELV